MARYAWRRLAASVPLFLLVAVLCWGLVRLAPGGPVSAVDPRLRGADRDRLVHALGLDRPLHEQFGSWLAGLVRGDLGTSLVTGEPVARMIRDRLPATLELMGTALLLSLVLGLGLGIAAALRRGTALDHILSTVSLIGVSVPVFWLALLAILLFSAKLGWLPAGGRETLGAAGSFADHLRHLVLPAVVLAVVQAPLWSRHVRASLLEVLGEDWLRSARARGLGRGRVLVRHALRPALAPVVTLLGLQAPALFTGAVITESIFAWPGMGRLFYEGAQRFDYPRVLGVLIVGSALVILCNLAADLAVARLDPRTADQEER
jgi:peptide/nickel transport system permease protein